MKSLLNWALILFFLTGCSENAPSLRALFWDRKASLALKTKNDEDALNSYLKILESDPELPSVHSNIGMLFQKSGRKPEDVYRSLEQALRLAEKQKNAHALFVIHYNLGTLYGAEKKVPEALDHYQAALEIVPDSKETKHNIELLIQNGSGGESGKNKKNDPNQGKGQGQSNDQKDQDKKDKNKDKNKDEDKDKKDDDSKDGDKDQDKKEPPKQSPKYKPRPFQGEQLSEGDVKKILGELKNQEQKIRANFEKKERKEKKNDKDW